MRPLLDPPSGEVSEKASSDGSGKTEESSVLDTSLSESLGCEW